jgi:hypothetical protein
MVEGLLVVKKLLDAYRSWSVGVCCSHGVAAVVVLGWNMMSR